MHAAFLVLALALPAAPVPFKKPPPPAPSLVPGKYVMVWQGVRCETCFHRDGFFACCWHGSWWHGRWKEEKGVVTVEEWPMDEPLRRSSWQIELACPKSGRLKTGERSFYPWSMSLPGPQPEI